MVCLLVSLASDSVCILASTQEQIPKCGIQTCIPVGRVLDGSLWEFISLLWKHIFSEKHRNVSAPFGPGSYSLTGLPFSIWALSHSKLFSPALALLRWGDIQPVCIILVILFVYSQFTALVMAYDLGIVTGFVYVIY